MASRSISIALCCLSIVMLVLLLPHVSAAQDQLPKSDSTDSTKEYYLRGNTKVAMKEEIPLERKTTEEVFESFEKMELQDYRPTSNCKRNCRP